MLTFSTVNKNWVPYEEFEDQEDQLTFLTKLSKDEGILDEDMKLETVYRWEQA